MRVSTSWPFVHLGQKPQDDDGFEERHPSENLTLRMLRLVLKPELAESILEHYDIKLVSEVISLPVEHMATIDQEKAIDEVSRLIEIRQRNKKKRGDEAEHEIRCRVYTRRKGYWVADYIEVQPRGGQTRTFRLSAKQRLGQRDEYSFIEEFKKPVQQTDTGDEQAMARTMPIGDPVNEPLQEGEDGVVRAQNAAGPSPDGDGTQNEDESEAQQSGGQATAAA